MAPGAVVPARRRCFVVDDEAAIRKLFYAALGGCDIDTSRLRIAWRTHRRLAGGAPTSSSSTSRSIRLGAIDVIRALATRKHRGAVQIVSGRDRALQEQVKRIGKQHGLVMLPPLQKPFRVAQLQSLGAEPFAHAQDDDAAEAAAPKAAADDFGLALTLPEILQKGWLQFYYQPKMDLQRRCIVGAEVLARCRHPDRGVIPPGAFLPDADPASAQKLTRLALSAALQNWSKFAAAGFPLKLAVNVSVDDLMTQPIVALVREQSPKDERWPGLILEVTEDQAVRDIALTQEIATQLRIYDITLALDDFGSGYSHLARLKELPFAEVKLDRNPVANCGEDKQNGSLCETAIDLAHHFGATVVAEGIEKRSSSRRSPPWAATSARATYSPPRCRRTA